MSTNFPAVPSHINNYPVLANRPASRRKGEPCVVVLVRRADMEDYATWMWNRDTGGAFEGHYDMTLTEAAEDFASRGGLRTCTLNYTIADHVPAEVRQLVREATVAAWSADAESS